MKKGQTSLFIILGIIIAAALVLGVYYRGIIISKITREEVPKSGVQNEADEIRSYVESCISSLAEAGLDQLGAQGGYIEIPEYDKPINLANPTSNRLSVMPGFDVAYWFYQDASSIQKLAVPNTASMEKELGKYIDNNLLRCTGDFSDSMAIVEHEQPKTSVEIEEKNIKIDTKFKIDVKKGNTTATIPGFSLNVAKPLGELYTYANKIMEYETKSNFIEEKTMDMMVVYDQIPYSGIDFECTPKTWSKINAVRNLKNVVSNNIQYIKITGTKYELADKKHKYFEVPAFDKEKEDIGVNFLFSEDWPMFVDILPDEPILKSESISSSDAGKFLSQLFCINYYNFVYSIRYPVLISLTKDDFTFQFAVQSIIDHNQPKQNRVDVEYFEGKEPRVCENPIENINVNAMGFKPDGSLIEVDDAKISFKCLGVTCDIGYSNENLLFPQCLNGLIIAEKDGYNKGEALISTNKEQDVSINLEKIYMKNLSVIVTNQDGGDRALLGSEIVLLQFEDEEQEYHVNAIYPFDRSISLMQGNYMVKATILANMSRPIQLKEEKLSTCTEMPKKGLLGIIGLTEKKCFESKIPGVTLTQAIVGGVEFEYSLGRDELATSRNLIVYVVRNRLPESVDDIPKIMELIQKNNQNKYFKTPMLR